MNAQNRNRLMAVGAIVLAGAALSVIAFSKIGDNLVYYWAPNDLIAAGEKAYGPTIRLGGIVAPTTVAWNPEHTRLHFKVAQSKSPDAPSVDVDCDQVPPQMFREGIGVVVEGTYDASHVFKTSRLMVNHSNEYRPPKPGENTKDWQKSLQDADSVTKK